MSNLDQALDKFLDHVNNLLKDYISRNNYTFLIERNAHIAKSAPGAKYMRLVHMEDGKARSIYCFVDLETGDLLKGSWKSPVKNGIRGNVFNISTFQNFDHHGPKYLK